MAGRVERADAQIAHQQHVVVVQPEAGERDWTGLLHHQGRTQHFRQLLGRGEVVGVGVGVDHVADMQSMPRAAIAL